jgi:hypothetical protein
VLLACGGCSTHILVAVDPESTLFNDLIGYWRFEDGAGSKTALDSSGNGNTGTLNQLDPSTAWMAGRSGGSLGVYAGGWVGVADSPTLDRITSQVTVSAWIYFDGTVNTTDLYGTAISREIGTGIDQHYHLSLNENDQPNLFVTTTDAIVRLNAADPAPQRTWTHVAGTYDGATARLYVNGAPATGPTATQALTGTFMADTTPLIIGGNDNDASGVPTELFPGRVDEIMLYRRALSAAEVAELAAGVLF